MCLTLLTFLRVFGRMKIFDEYWLSLGEDSGKVKRMKKKKMREAAIKKAADEEEKEVRLFMPILY